jgi:hypothetical protein
VPTSIGTCAITAMIVYIFEHVPMEVGRHLMTPRLLARLDQIAAGWCDDATCRASLDETDAACAGDDPSSRSQASESERLLRV